MAGEFAAGLAALKGAGDILAGLVAARDLQKFSGDLIALQTQIIAAQSSLMALQQEHSAAISRQRELEAQIVEMEKWDAEADRYALKADKEGSIFYALKEAMKGSDPPHRICANCYAARKKSYLQKGEVIHRRLTLACTTCKTVIPVSEQVAYA